MKHVIKMKGTKIIPLKIALMTGWENSVTVKIDLIDSWSRIYTPRSNCNEKIMREKTFRPTLHNAEKLFLCGALSALPRSAAGFEKPSTNRV